MVPDDLSAKCTRMGVAVAQWGAPACLRGACTSQSVSTRASWGCRVNAARASCSETDQKRRYL